MLWLIRIGVENLSGDVPALQSPEESFPSDLLGPVFDLADHEEWCGDQADENEHHAECDADDRASIRQINSPITPPMIVENTVLDRASVLFVIMNVFLRSIDAVDETSVMSSMVSLGCNCLCSPMNMFPDQIPR